MVYNRKPTRECFSREYLASPTVSLESIIMTAIFDAIEERNVMSAYLTNTFIQKKMPDIEDGEERVIMKIIGVLVDLLVEMAPKVYIPYVVFKNVRKVLYVQFLGAL